MPARDTAPRTGNGFVIKTSLVRGTRWRAAARAPVARRGVAHEDHAAQVERVLACGRAQGVDPVAGVQKGSRPAAAGLVFAAVFHIPGGPSFAQQGGGQGRGVIGGGEIAVAAAVQQHHHRERSPARGQTQFGELLRRGAVRDFGGGWHAGEPDDIGGTHMRVLARQHTGEGEEAGKAARRHNIEHNL